MHASLNLLRVAYENWEYEDRFSRLLELIDEYRDGISEVALFTSSTHSPLTWDEFSRRIAVIEKCLPKLRNAGFKAGINHLTTIGHHCEDLDAGLGDKYTYMTNIQGEVCRGSYCVRDPGLIEEYIIPCYTLMANTKPDFIWIDDDIRYGHMPIGQGCFCDRCIEAFNATYGYSFTRESLREALNKNDVELRMKWLTHNCGAITDLLAAIADCVYAINPNIVLGFMTGEHYFGGYRFDLWADALSQSGKHEIMWRPGGGAYEDFNFDLIVKKQSEIGRQNAYLPDYVKIVQSEIENFPYQLLKKTPLSTAFEASMTMTVGCSGAAFNILPSENMEPLDTIIPHLKAIRKMTDFYKVQQKLLFGLKPVGIHSGWRPLCQAACGEGEFVSQKGTDLSAYARECFVFGLPEAYHPDFASVTMLKGQAAAVMDDDEILRILSGGVYIDAPAVEYLTERGFGRYLGFKVEKNIPVDAREIYLDVPFNDGIAGGVRNCRQAFYFGDSYSLKPLSEKCQTIARLIDYHNRVLGECSVGLYENELGGRICAAGYYPHSWVLDGRKTEQLKRIFVWLSKGTLPSYVDSYSRIRNITLTDGKNNRVTLFNTSNDVQENVTVAVRTDSDTMTLYTMTDGEKTLKASVARKICGNTYRYFNIDRINAFEGVILA